MTTTPKKHPVLIVDDEPEILFSLELLLRRDFELYTAQSGSEALDILHQHPVDVIMTDQRMPRMTGVELLRRARGECPEAVRIIFTGYADIRAVIDAINEGRIYRYLVKPWDPDDLRQLLHEACDYHDRMIERERLLVDLRDHLARRQAVGAGAVAGDGQQLDAAETGLLARLDRLLGDRAGP